MSKLSKKEEMLNILLRKTNQKYVWLKKMENRSTYKVHPVQNRINLANEQYPTVVATKDRGYRQPVPPDIVSEVLAKQMCSNSNEDYDNACLFLGRLGSRAMTEKRYNELVSYFCRGFLPTPYNPPEARPKVIYPDAEQYRTDMQKLAEGLEQRLGAIKV